MIQNADMRLESGTCNVCSAPCSSCMHLNHALMGSKAEEFSDENGRLGEASNKYSIDESNLSSLRSRACESLQHAVSETSNMLGVNSGHDSLSENAESRQQTLSNKYQDSKYLEGHDDNTSFISRASDANVESTSHQRNADRINIPRSSASVSCLGAEGSGSTPSVDMSGLSEIPSSKDVDTGHSSPKVQGLNGQSQRGKSLSDSPSLMHQEGSSCYHIPARLSEFSIENSNSSLTKETPTIVVSGEKSMANEDSLIDAAASAKVSSKICPKPEADTDNVGEAKDEGHKCSVNDGQHEKVGELVKSHDKQELQSEDESDESDVVEHDVKVCDICGDAGREDLLAICSRCSDGAEHTYCMREMLQKVPEADWLCEECKDADEIENQRLDVEEKKFRKVSSTTSQVSSKLLSENTEVAPAAKRQALESITGSPKALSPKRLVPLSRESSFKSLDKGKVKPGHLMPNRNHSGGDDTEIAHSPSIGHRSQIPKSTLLKCSSFNNLSKPRVKLVDEVPHKLKGSGEQNSKNLETPARMTGKSMLFKSSSLGRSNATEPKVKMLSPKPETAQELKGSRHLKETGTFDRKFPSRIDRPVVKSSKASSVVSMAKGDQKLTSRGETTKPSAVNNNRELKNNQDGKLSTLSKSMSNVSRKTMEPQVSSERTSTSVVEALHDVLPRSREAANQFEKTRGYNDRSRPVVTTASKSPFCQKCKEYGHVLEFCTAGNTQESRAEASVTAPSSSKEDMHNGNRLKAAIQAALLRRPEIYKKKEVSNQTDELSTSGTDLNSEVTSQDQLMVSNTPKNTISAEETHEQQEILENSTSDSSKCSSANDLKQLNCCPTDFCSQPGKSDSIGLASGKPIVRGLSNKSLAIPSVLSKMLVVPEYEYIWQGVFELHRNEKPPDFCAGVQAHLSSCASPKVLEAVNKFQPKVPLTEVSRLSSWPSQFHQVGAREDHIALYFFAKDVKSYERHYKGLLDHMIRNDLALKGNFAGVELLIFPSNQLPESSQRWNMLFFLWGVFRGRRITHSDSTKKIYIPSLNAMPVEEDSSTAAVTSSETHCLAKHMGEESIACDKVRSTLSPCTSVDLGQPTSSGNIDINDQTDLNSQVNLEKQDSGVYINSTSRVLTGSTLLCQEMESNGSSLKDNVLEHGQCREPKPPEAMETSVSHRIVETKTDFDISVEQEKALSSGVDSVGNQELSTASKISKDKMSERMNSDEGQQRPKGKQITDDHYIDLEANICNHGRGAGSTPIIDNSGRMNDDEDQQRPKRKLTDDDHFIDLEATIENQETGAASNISKDKPSERMNGDEDQQIPKRKQNVDHYIDLEATVDDNEADAASNISEDKILGRMDSDEGQQWPKMKHKDDDYIDLEATFQGDPTNPTVVGVNCQLPNDQKALHVDLSDTFMKASAVSCQKRPWNEVNVKLEDGGSSSKKLKTGFGGIYGCYSSEGRDSFNASFASIANHHGSCSSVENKGCEAACGDEKIIREDVGTMERTFFPVDSQNISDAQLVLNSLSLKGPHEYADQFQDLIPNLELGLGGDIKPPPPKGMLPFLVGAVDRKNGQEIHPNGLADEQEDDGAAASLSLSLSFPSSNKEHTTKPALKAAEVLPDAPRVNTPFLLFGRYTDK